MNSADIGLIGLAVMGQNLALNINDHGYKVVAYNRSTQKVDDFLNGAAKRSEIVGAYSPAELAAKLQTPRKIILMVRAGEAVDQTIEALLPHLQQGDIIIDGGNSHFPDTDRRTAELAKQGIHFLGCGISGGEEGARNGPSIMPGGNPEGWPALKPIFQAIAAKVDDQACCQWVGEGGAGHYVKMVHNGIEYGDMQLICEAYHLMRTGLGQTIDETQKVFSRWNQGVLDSYLIEITADILGFTDEQGNAIVEQILDSAGQKGTGKWTGISALELGAPLTLIGEAVFARFLSALNDERRRAAPQFVSEGSPFDGDSASIIDDIHDALYASKIISYAQGYMLMREAAKAYGWQLSFGDIALMWRGGCIIRSVFLADIKRAFDDNPQLDNLLLAPFFTEAIKKAEPGWRRAVMFGIQQGIPMPAFSSALAFFDGYRCECLPANLLQAQRDYFGAHMYERIDQPRGQFFHTDWIGSGAAASSSTYQV
ncbi:MAG: decarboxylating NADP(+)-dependent phosphogluconate dehydrogenase [Candidatus Polarisedimenticolaceae bacterium]|nr:decarboxylating NADP(+)-dependent phosphogluconate dehydrogenase [Candidatus Polarisedimenticolaceae bacterium]